MISSVRNLQLTEGIMLKICSGKNAGQTASYCIRQTTKTNATEIIQVVAYKRSYVTPPSQKNPKTHMLW